MCYTLSSLDQLVYANDVCHKSWDRSLNICSLTISSGKILSLSSRKLTGYDNIIPIKIEKLCINMQNYENYAKLCQSLFTIWRSSIFLLYFASLHPGYQYILMWICDIFKWNFLNAFFSSFFCEFILCMEKISCKWTFNEA